ncbi:nitrate/sulfonate/bicarbonate ABC transporter permease [Amycolatopsis mediterranei S699]|uniref:Permease component of ABC-type nitrate/sulfonate/bicarbonate transport system n=2 Tax=Amycolatopsis mediterranei TaxID=33910 RepID=A0A0H3DKI6_AMYMU|nr:ABC transporter permease [Amycolatopsis mediterranei]ADJ50229.1 permease component of ABC-type nitrate/sulfonate/bicarbonate transport system [Amycolatopsis mediterranei U32]AEK47227.1 nitrate/sulfonate/bicarbonate ABC transporter permease [Amycolatopsis mediterranei S699]AFO81937.1 nitrate/sulfonate/bicarbonate ABC transporter permease [Amycolatopsis mediterranei S699]AGT89066.1 nitrate/sulfonate/bicarbonate ABC transporter permease [Amycolatopsis mediterranei RB]KDO07522.1 nitrate ABC tra
MKKLLRGLAGLVGFLLLWEVLVQVGLVDRTFTPPPSVVLGTVGDLLGDPDFIRDIVATMLAWLIAIAVAIAVGVPAGLLLGSVPALRTATAAIVEFLRPIPITALVPLVLLVIGSGPEAKITLAVYASLWPIMFNTIYGMGEIDPVLMETARACGTSRFRILTSVALPQTAPFVFTGVRLSATISLIAVVSVEFLAGSQLGLGSFIIVASTGSARFDLVLAGTVVAGALGYLINEGLEQLGKRLFRWSTVDREAIA